MGWTSLPVLVVFTALRLSRCCVSSSLPASRGDTSSYAHVLLVQQQGPEVRIQQMNLFNGESQHGAERVLVKAMPLEHSCTGRRGE
jgi:hypothetical protein